MRFGLIPIVDLQFRQIQQRLVLNLAKDIRSGRVSRDAVVEAALEDGQIRFVNVGV